MKNNKNNKIRRKTRNFIRQELWPPNSPDLNPVDYEIWGIMQDRVYQTAIHDVDELKQHLIAVWADIKQSVIDEWRSRSRGGILNICFVEHEHYFFACLTVCLRNFINVAEIAKTTLCVP